MLESLERMMAENPGVVGCATLYAIGVPFFFVVLALVVCAADAPVRRKDIARAALISMLWPWLVLEYLIGR